jgi:ElaA protein
MRWDVRGFAALTGPELYAIVKLRQDVFIVEQKCAYADADGLDAAATHLFALDGDGGCVAYARLFAPGVRRAEAVIGRVVTAASVRRSGMGRELMQRAIDLIEARYGKVAIWLGAQKYIERFYASFGFLRDGDDYDEDGIAHLPMRRPEDPQQSRV